MRIHTTTTSVHLQPQRIIVKRKLSVTFKFKLQIQITIIKNTTIEVQVQCIVQSEYIKYQCISQSFNTSCNTQPSAPPTIAQTVKHQNTAQQSRHRGHLATHESILSARSNFEGLQRNAPYSHEKRCMRLSSR